MRTDLISLLFRYPLLSKQHFIFLWTVTFSIRRAMRPNGSWPGKRGRGNLVTTRVREERGRRGERGRKMRAVKWARQLGRRGYATNSTSVSEPHRH